MKNVLRTFAALLGAAALIGHGPAAHAQMVIGSGKVVTESRAVSGFQAIESRGAVKLVLRQGSREGIELGGEDNILPLIETRVVDRDGVPTLEIGPKRGTMFTTRSPLTAAVDLVTLKAIAMSGGGSLASEALKTPSLKLALSGSANVKLRQLSVDELSVNVSGSGELEFGGKATRLAVSISGSGDVNSRALEADDVSVSVAGSGDANVTARKTLNVSIAGSGSVVYAGDAVVKSSIAGHGSVRKQ